MSDERSANLFSIFTVYSYIPSKIYPLQSTIRAACTVSFLVPVRTEQSAVLDLADDVGAAELEHTQRDEAVVDVDHAARRHHVRHVRVVHPDVRGVAARAPRLVRRHRHARAAHELHLRRVRLRRRRVELMWRPSYKPVQTSAN